MLFWKLFGTQKPSYFYLKQYEYNGYIKHCVDEYYHMLNMTEYEYVWMLLVYL